MYGWRGRIGLIVPSTDSVCEMDFHRLVPEGVSIHTARIALLENHSELFDWKKPSDWEKGHQIMHDDYTRAAKMVAHAQVQVIVFGCTSGSFIKGTGTDEEICQRIQEAVWPFCGRIPIITTSKAILEALRELKIKKVSVATPYISKGNEQEKIFLEASGFEVVDIKGLEIEAFGEYGKQDPLLVYKLARMVNSNEADGVIISCTDFRALDVIEMLERDLQKPIISSNQASIWLALKKLGINESISGYGTLLKSQNNFGSSTNSQH